MYSGKYRAKQPRVRRKLRSTHFSKLFCHFRRTRSLRGADCWLEVSERSSDVVTRRDARLTLAANLSDRLIASAELPTRILPFLYTPRLFLSIVSGNLFAAIFIMSSFYIESTHTPRSMSGFIPTKVALRVASISRLADS